MGTLTARHCLFLFMTALLVIASSALDARKAWAITVGSENVEFVPPPGTTIVKLASGRSYHELGDLLIPLPAQGTRSYLTGSQWPGGVLHYEFDENSFGPAEKSLFRGWIAEWSQRTGVSFIEDLAPDRVFVSIATGAGCGRSAVGRIGGVQDMVIGPGDCFNAGTVNHEIGHALGLLHEHTRSDRNSFVSIEDLDGLQACSPALFTANYDVRAGAGFSAYDFASIMHYSNLGFFTCGGQNRFVRISAIATQPPGPPVGSGNVCSTLSQCNNLMGNNFISARDAHGMSLYYGYRLRIQRAGGDGSGNFNVAPSAESCGDSCFLLKPTQTYTITALPASGSVLTSFSGACSGQTCSIAPERNEEVSLRFVSVATLRKIRGLVATRMTSTQRLFANGFE